MNSNMEQLNQVIVGLADLVREVRTYGRTARFDMRAPALLDEAMQALKQGGPAAEMRNPLPQGMVKAAWNR
jgi:hypothetical protein